MYLPEHERLGAMTTTSTTCDACGTELSIDSSYPANYGLALAAKDFGRNTSGVTFGVAMYPPLEREHHFCGLGCLGRWLNKEAE